MLSSGIVRVSPEKCLNFLHKVVIWWTLINFWEVVNRPTLSESWDGKLITAL